MKNWHEDALCKLHIDYHTPGHLENICENFSANEVAEKIAGAGFEAVQFFTKGHFGNSYYPTKAGHRHSGLKRDLFGELAEALSKKGIIVMAYYSLRPDSQQAKTHPDWAVKNNLEEKEFTHMSNNRAMCFQSPYLEEIALPQIREVAERYPIASFFFDFARSAGYCGCKYCQEQYLKDSGRELPPNDSSSDNWNDYVEWKRGEQERVESLLEKAVHEAKPEALFTVNYSYTLRNPRTVPEYYGFISMDVKERCSYALNVSLNSKYLAARGKTWDIMTSRMINWWSGWGLKPLNALLYQNAVILAHGGKTFLADRADIDWKLDDEVYSYFKKANGFIKKLWDISRDSELKIEAGIFLSRASYYASNSPSNEPMERLIPIQGAHRILTMKHRQHLILDDESLEKYIDKIKLLIVPEQSLIDDSSALLIKSFVEGGGRLIASGSTLQAHPVMAELFGVKDAGECSRVFIKPPEWAVDENVPSLDIACDCPAKIIELNTAKSLTDLFMPVFNLENQGLGFGSPDRTKSFPGISENNYGKGKAIYISPDIFSCYIKINNPPIKHFIDKLVLRCLETPLLESNAHENIEFVMAEKDGGTLLHMINFAEERSESEGQTAMIDSLPELSSFNVKLRLAKEANEIISLPDGVPVKWHKELDCIQIKTQPFCLYQCLLISF